MEVAVERKGNVRYYEWRISLGAQLVVGKSVGLDFTVFDKDSDASFTSNSWGRGGQKFRIPGNLGDVILLPENQKMTTVKGSVSWDRKMKAPLPLAVRVTSIQNPALWLTTEIDSSGNYSAEIPAGRYEFMLPDPYFQSGEEIYSAIQKKPVLITVKAGQQTVVERLVVSGTPVPDLLPEKGILHDFNSATARQGFE